MLHDFLIPLDFSMYQHYGKILVIGMSMSAVARKAADNLKRCRI